jgi:methionine synthase II (cobalamin-independent)
MLRTKARSAPTRSAACCGRASRRHRARGKGEITAEDLRKAEDLEIKKVGTSKPLGLKLATDGELRRSWWHFDFLASSLAANCTTSTMASSLPVSRPGMRRDP